MSFAFDIIALSHDAAKEAAVKELNLTQQHQPSHKADLGIVATALDAQLDLVVLKPGHQLRMSISGSLGGTWKNNNELSEIHASNICINIYQTAIPAEAKAD